MVETTRPLADMTMPELRAEAHHLGIDGRFRDKESVRAAIRGAKRAHARTKPGGPGTIREAAERILRKPIPYSQALAELKAEFPGAHTSRASLRWYTVQMRKRGERLPHRPYDNPMNAVS